MNTILIILFLLLLNSWLSPKGQLYCGIFGFCGKGSIDKIRMLGIKNDERGGDGTGYFYNNEIHKGVYAESRFANFIKKTKLKQQKSKVFIGHTRKSTSSTYSLDSTHPFEVDNLLVLTHNGVIYNIDELCEKYDVDNSNIDVDSHALAVLINKVGFKVLEEYVGFAALAFTYKDKPDTLYLYHGKSKEYQTATAISEERPLFYLLTKDCLYYSSIKESLELISEEEEDVVEQLNWNAVFEIKNGKFTGNTVLINREQANDDINKHRYKNTSTSYPNYNYGNNTHTNRALPPVVNANSSIINAARAAINNTSFRPLDIKYQSLPESMFNICSLFWMYGRFFLTNSQISKKLAHGLIFADKDSGVWRYADVDEKMLNEVKHSVGGKTYTLSPYWFFNGVMLKKNVIFETVEKICEDFIPGTNTNKLHLENFARLISSYSRYPVSLLSNATDFNSVEENPNVKGDDRLRWWMDGVFANATDLKPQFSDITVTIKGGHLSKFGKVYSPINTTKESIKEHPINKFCTTKLTTVHHLDEMPDGTEILIDMYIRDVCTSFDSFNVLTDQKKEESLVKTKTTFLTEIISEGGTIKDRIDDIAPDFKYDQYLSWTLKIVNSTVAPTEPPIDVNWASFNYDVVEEDKKEDDVIVATENGLVIETRGAVTTIKVDKTAEEHTVEEETEDDTIDDIDELHDRAILEIEEDDEEVCDSIKMMLLEECPLSKTADLIVPYQKSEIGKEITEILYRASEVLLADIKNVAQKHNHEELLSAIVKKQNLY